jgi:hypothetical protein
MTKPTYEDATLIIQLAQLAASSGVMKGQGWIFSDKFIPDYKEFVEKYPPGSKSYARVSTMCGWFETIGTLYKNGLINGDLLFDWLAVRLVWDRVSGFALGVREQSGEPRMYENFEAMAKAQPN